ncbi:MAG: hypothetical protein AAFY73_04280 [Pseudomonadota bacterium]
MIFNIRADTIDEIVGYVVPDGFSAEPRIRVVSNGEVLGRFPCTLVEPWFERNKRHQTGLVGFKLTTRELPDLETLLDLTLLDDASGLMLYRRRDWSMHVTGGLFRLETSFLPKARLDNAARHYFQYAATSIERYGIETVQSMLAFENIASIYLSGRIQPRNVLDLIEKRFSSVVAISHPAYELAVRAVVLARTQPDTATILTRREQAAMTDWLDLFTPENTRDAASIIKTLKSAPTDAVAMLSSPLTKQLSGDDPSAKLSASSLVNALDTISQFSSVTLSEENEAMRDAIASLAGVSNQVLPAPRMYPELMNIADELTDSLFVQNVLETDLILYQYIKDAVARGTRASAQKAEAEPGTPIPSEDIQSV